MAYHCIYPQAGCNVEALPREWRPEAYRIADKIKTRPRPDLKYRGCVCSYGNHRRLTDTEVGYLERAGFLVEMETDDEEEYDPCPT